jgi:drug/metabolite transporter (DMT)-like permease
MSAKEWAMLIFLSVLWGSSFLFVELAITGFPTLTIVAIRLIGAAIILWGIAIALGHPPPRDWPTWQVFFIMGLLNNAIPFTLIVWGQTHISSGLASLLIATAPLFSVLVAGVFLTDERATPLKLLGCLTGFAGVAVMFGGPAVKSTTQILAMLAILGAALCYAFAGAYGRRFRTMSIRPIVAAAGQITASAFILIPAVLAIDAPIDLSSPSFGAWVAVTSLAVMSTALAYVIYFHLLETAGATNILLVTLLVPISAIFLGVLFLNEVLAPAQIAGMVLIGLGLSAIDGRIWRRLKALIS